LARSCPVVFVPQNTHNKYTRPVHLQIAIAAAPKKNCQ